MTAVEIDTHVSTGLEDGGGDDDGRISTPMIAALEGAWAAIRARHPEVPAVVLLLGAGSIGAAAGSLTLGTSPRCAGTAPHDPVASSGTASPPPTATQSPPHTLLPTPTL
ncbi:MAG: hypothetical protein ACRDRH_11020 [Pseudonocardia sp.]